MISRPHVIRSLKAVGISLLVVAAVCLVVGEIRAWRHSREYGAKVWFYNQATKQLYPAAADTIPPDSLNRDGVRALVIAFDRRAKDRNALKIAYLETYSPDLKHLLEVIKIARAAGQVFNGRIPARGSSYFETNTLVRRLNDPDWYPVTTTEGRKITTEWRSWRGPHGERPVANVPE